MFLGWSANLFSAWITNSIHTKLWDDIAHTCPNFHDGVSASQHYSDAIMGTIASQITRLTVVYSTVYSLAFAWGIEFPAQRASYAENVSIWWRHHGFQLRHGYENTSRGMLWHIINYPWPNEFIASRLFWLSAAADNHIRRDWCGGPQCTLLHSHRLLVVGWQWGWWCALKHCLQLFAIAFS